MIKSFIRFNSKSYDNIIKKSVVDPRRTERSAEDLRRFTKSFRLTGASLVWVVCDRKCVVRCIFKFCDSDAATELAIEATSKLCVVSCPSGWQVKANCETPISDQLDMGAGRTWLHQHRVIGAKWTGTSLSTAASKLVSKKQRINILQRGSQAKTKREN